MRTRLFTALAAASLVGTGMMTAAPAEARTVVSVGFGIGAPAYRPYYGPRYYPRPYWGAPVAYYPRPYPAYRPYYPVRAHYRYGWHRW